MPVNATVTAQSGPARQVTAGVFTGCTGITITPDRKILTLQGGPDGGGKEFDLSTVTTITVVISGLNYNVTVS